MCWRSNEANKPRQRFALCVEEDLRRRRELLPKVECVESRGSVFRMGAQTVLLAVFSGESRTPLQDDIGLPGNPIAAALRMREKGQRIARVCIIGGSISCLVSLRLGRMRLIGRLALSGRQMWRSEAQNQQAQDFEDKLDE